MPYPARTTIDEPEIGRHETPMRGSTMRLSGLISELGYLSPVNEPTGSLATTGATLAKPEVTSMLTRRFNSSVIGAPYSQRAPALIVNSGLTRKSSVTKASYTDSRKYLSALPYARLLVSGLPNRKSAKSEPP